MTNQSLANVVTPVQLSIALDTFIDAQIPAFIWGSPGIGKSNIVAQTAERKNMQLIDVRAVLFDPTDVKGFPYKTKDNRMAWAIPDYRYFRTSTVPQPLNKHNPDLHPYQNQPGRGIRIPNRFLRADLV